MLAEYIYLNDQLLAMIRPGENVYYYHNDRLGTPQILTDARGNIAWKANYTPVGNKEFPGGRHYGVIAQEIEKTLPEVVNEGADGEKAVSYSEIIPVLIEAIREQQRQIEGLKEEILQLKQKR